MKSSELHDKVFQGCGDFNISKLIGTELQVSNSNNSVFENFRIWS